MKPKKILLIRHGESWGNVKEAKYEEICCVTPDYAIELTDNGKRQAIEAGTKIKDMLIGSKKLAVYYSPYHRTIQTLNGVAKSLPNGTIDKKYVREDPRLREQEWFGKYIDDDLIKKNNLIIQEKERFLYGHFYYRFLTGESPADVYNRVSGVIESINRDFDKVDFPDNLLIVTHGMTMRLFIMKWFHFSVSEFEEWKNPKNCHIIEMDLQDNNKYRLMTEMKTSNNNRHQFSCKLEI